MKHFLTLSDFSKEEIQEMLDLAFTIKLAFKAGKSKKYMENQTL